MQLAIQRMSMCRMQMRSDIFLPSPFFTFLFFVLWLLQQIFVQFVLGQRMQ